MTGLEKRIGYRFENKELLVNALTHSSYANENKKQHVQSNERLEFFGDALLGVVVAKYLYINRPEMPEGEMTRLRAELVCERSLHEVAEELSLGEYLRLGKGEENSGGRTRISLLADAIEAIIAAMFLDGGRDPVNNFIGKFILVKVETTKPAARDYKTMLQELVQKTHENSIMYCLTGESGPDHQKIFTVDVQINGAVVGSGIGKSKKEAEQAAAKIALEKLVG